MEAGNIVNSLQKLGFTLQINEDKINLSFPGGKPPETAGALLAKLKERKPEIIDYLKSQQEQPQQAHVIDFAAEASKVEARLQQHGIAKICSDTLGEDVFFTIDDQTVVKAPKGATVYTLSELRELLHGKMDWEGLRQIHQIKKTFNGRIIEREDSKGR